MIYLTSKNWWECAGTRAIKTVAQSFIACVGTSTFISQVDWKVVVSTSLLSGILSLATSLSGLPEVSEG